MVRQASFLTELFTKLFQSSKILIIIFSTQKMRTYTQGVEATSLDDYIQSSGIDPATCPTNCLEDVSKICTNGTTEGNENLVFFYKCPTWEDDILYCHQALEGKFSIRFSVTYHNTVSITVEYPSISTINFPARIMIGKLVQCPNKTSVLVFQKRIHLLC